MHSQCFLVLHQSEGCELVKLWAASGTFPVVDRREANRGCTELRVRTHILSAGVHTDTLRKHPFTGRAAITSQIHRRRGSTDTEPLTNGPGTGAAPQMDWQTSIQSLTDENKWDLLFCFCPISPDPSVYLGSVMVLFFIGSDKTSSIVMPPEDPVRQDMQFYYMVSRGITYSNANVYILVIADSLHVIAL